MIRFLQSGNRAVKLVLSAFLLIICVSMVVYLIPGVGTDITAGGIVAKVGGEEITVNDVQRKAADIERQQGRAIPDFLKPYMMQRALQQATQEAEIRYEAHRMGFTVSDEELRDELRNGANGPYLFPDGKWIGQDKYEELLRGASTTPDEFEKSMRYDLLARKLMGTIVAGVDASPWEIEKLYKDQHTKVKFEYAFLKQDDLKKQLKPTDSELKAYFESNKQQRYLAGIPEKRQVRYFVLPDKEAQSKVRVTPEEVQNYYSQHQEEFRIPEEVRTRHILIKTPPPGPDGKVDQKAVEEARAKADDVLKQIRAGGDLAELAKKYSEDTSKDQGGELGWTHRGQFVAEYEAAAYGQNVGQISEPVKSRFGFHIIQTEEKKSIKPFAEVKDTLATNLKQQRTGDVMDRMIKDAEAVAKNQGLDKAAAKVNAQVVQSNPIARTDSLPGIGPSPQVMQSIFGAADKTGPQTARYAQGYAIFQVTKIDPARTPAFDEIKDRVTEDYKTSRSALLLQQKIQELADRAHAEHDLNKAAKEAGATVKSSDLVGRASQVPEIGSMSGAAKDAFNLKPGEISGALSNGPTGFVITLSQREDPSTTDDKFAKAKDGMRDQIVNQKRQQALQLFINNLESRLEKEGKKKINKTEVDNLTKSRS